MPHEIVALRCPAGERGLPRGCKDHVRNSPLAPHRSGPPPIMSSPLAAIDRFPSVRLGQAPTPLEAAPRLGAPLGVELWIKRDDCTGLAFGGNKVR